MYQNQSGLTAPKCEKFLSVSLRVKVSRSWEDVFTSIGPLTSAAQFSRDICDAFFLAQGKASQRKDTPSHSILRMVFVTSAHTRRDYTSTQTLICHPWDYILNKTFLNARDEVHVERNGILPRKLLRSNRAEPVSSWQRQSSAKSRIVLCTGLTLLSSFIFDQLRWFLLRKL